MMERKWKRKEKMKRKAEYPDHTESRKCHRDSKDRKFRNKSSRLQVFQPSRNCNPNWASNQHRNNRSADGQTASCSHAEQQENELEIPGFYYDSEKKRYFKIAPNHCPNAVTRDVIKKKEAEIKRLEDVKILHGKKTAKQDKSTSKNHSVHVQKASNLNLTSVIFSYRTGCLNSEKLCNHIIRSQVTNLKPVSSQCLTESLSSVGGYHKLEHTQMMLLNKDHNDLLSLWSLKDTWVQRMQLVKINEKQRLTENNPISVHGEPHGKVIIQSLNKVTDICWAPLVNNSQEEHVLYTTICHTGYLNSLAMIRSLSAEQEEQPTFIDFNLGKRATWACAWNRQRQQFSVGSEKCALTLDVERRTMWEFYTNNSDPLTQVFSNQTGNCLHTGTRNGFVLTHDLRSRSTRPVCSLQHKSSVCSVKLLENDVSVLASDFTGRICQWDLRNKQPVLEYPGHNNFYTKLPLHVDESERILYTVGEDGYTRFWCLRYGTLLHTIPPPCPTSRETIPSVQFSMRWGNRMGNSGLIMGLEDKLYFYGSLPVT